MRVTTKSFELSQLSSASRYYSTEPVMQSDVKIVSIGSSKCHHLVST